MVLYTSDGVTLFEAVPRKVEQPDGDLPIDLMRSRQLGIVCRQAISG